jgi:hypothetical protein
LFTFYTYLFDFGGQVNLHYLQKPMYKKQDSQQNLLCQFASADDIPKEYFANTNILM